MRLHPEDETIEHWHDPAVDVTTIRNLTPAQQQIADILGWPARMCERDWRKVRALAAITDRPSVTQDSVPPPIPYPSDPQDGTGPLRATTHRAHG